MTCENECPPISCGTGHARIALDQAAREEQRGRRLVGRPGRAANQSPRLQACVGPHDLRMGGRPPQRVEHEVPDGQPGRARPRARRAAPAAGPRRRRRSRRQASRKPSGPNRSSVPQMSSKSRLSVKTAAREARLAHALASGSARDRQQHVRGRAAPAARGDALRRSLPSAAGTPGSREGARRSTQLSGPQYTACTSTGMRPAASSCARSAPHAREVLAQRREAGPRGQQSVDDRDSR